MAKAYHERPAGPQIGRLTSATRSITVNSNYSIGEDRGIRVVNAMAAAKGIPHRLPGCDDEVCAVDRIARRSEYDPNPPYSNGSGSAGNSCLGIGCPQRPARLGDEVVYCELCSRLVALGAYAERSSNVAPPDPEASDLLLTVTVLVAEQLGDLLRRSGF